MEKTIKDIGKRFDKELKEKEREADDEFKHLHSKILKKAAKKNKKHEHLNDENVDEDEFWMMQLFDEEQADDALIEEDAEKFKTIRHKHVNYLSDDDKEKVREKQVAPKDDMNGLMSLFGWVF